MYKKLIYIDLHKNTIFWIGKWFASLQNLITGTTFPICNSYKNTYVWTCIEIRARIFFLSLSKLPLFLRKRNYILFNNVTAANIVQYSISVFCHYFYLGFHTHRFRHLDTMVRLKTGGTGSRRGSSNGCSPDPSPSASPSRGRSPNGRA